MRFAAVCAYITSMSERRFDGERTMKSATRCVSGSKENNQNMYTRTQVQRGVSNTLYLYLLSHIGLLLVNRERCHGNSVTHCDYV